MFLTIDQFVQQFCIVLETLVFTKLISSDYFYLKTIGDAVHPIFLDFQYQRELIYGKNQDGQYVLAVLSRDPHFNGNVVCVVQTMEDFAFACDLMRGQDRTNACVNLDKEQLAEKTRLDIDNANSGYDGKGNPGYDYFKMITSEMAEALIKIYNADEAGKKYALPLLREIFWNPYDMENAIERGN